VVLLNLGDRPSTVGFVSTDFCEMRDFWTGEGVPESDLVDPGRPILLFGVAGTVLLFEVSDKLDLFKIQIWETAHNYFQSLWLNFIIVARN